MSLSTAEWIAIAACAFGALALIVSLLAWWKLRAVRSSQLVLLGGGKQDLVEDSGDFQEFNVGVTLTIQKSPKPIVLRKKIPVINAGEMKTVTFTNIDINGLFGLPTTVKVDIEPVPGETTTTNNAAEFKVIFSLG